RGKDAVGWVQRGGELVKRDVALPLVLCVSDGNIGDSVGAIGDLPDGLVANVPLVVGVNDVKRRAPPMAHRRAEDGPVGGGIKSEERKAVLRNVVRAPAQGDGALLVRDELRDDGTVAGAGYVNVQVAAKAHANGLVLMLDGLP